MSATGRSKASALPLLDDQVGRHPDDFYRTPEWCTRAMLPHLPAPDGAWNVLEPGCGDGAIAKVLTEAGYGVVGVELSEQRLELARPHLRAYLGADFLAAWPRQDWSHQRFRIAVGNPPYKLAQEFIEQALSMCDEVCFLLRLNFLGSQKRAAFHHAHPADVFVLPRRPSFNGKGTDSIEYAWFIFGPERQRHVHVLDLGGVK